MGVTKIPLEREKPGLASGQVFLQDDALSSGPQTMTKEYGWRTSSSYENW